MQLIEQDTGGPNDFYSISLDLVVKPRSTVATQAKLCVSLDDILTLRHIPASVGRDARVRLHARGAVPLAELCFPNGPDACQSFILALRMHATLHQLTDPNVPGTLYAVEAKPRMRRVAPTLMPLYFPQPARPLYFPQPGDSARQQQQQPEQQRRRRVEAMLLTRRRGRRRRIMMGMTTMMRLTMSLIHCCQISTSRRRCRRRRRRETTTGTKTIRAITSFPLRRRRRLHNGVVEDPVTAMDTQETKTRCTASSLTAIIITITT